MQNSKLVEDYHLNNPDKSLLTQIGWMDIKAYKNGGAAVFANDDYGKSINADFIIGSPYHEQLKVHDDGDGRKSMHQNPMFWSRYIKINRGNNDKNKGTYYIYEQSHGFVYNGRYTGLKIDPENRWTHNTDNEKILDQFKQEEKKGSFNHWTQEFKEDELNEQVSRINNLSSKEKNTDKPEVKTLRENIDKINILMEEISIEKPWNKNSINNLLSVMGQEDYFMSNGTSGVSDGNYGKINHRTDDGNRLQLIFGSDREAANAYDTLSTQLGSSYSFDQNLDGNRNVLYVELANGETLEELVSVETKIGFQKGYGYWDVTTYPQGGDFHRFTGEEVGTLVKDGPVKREGEVRVQLDGGKVIVCKDEAITDAQPQLDAGSREEYMNDSGMGHSLTELEDPDINYDNDESFFTKGENGERKFVDRLSLPTLIQSHLSDMQSKYPEESGMLNFLKALIQKYSRGIKDMSEDEINAVYKEWAGSPDEGPKDDDPLNEQRNILIALKSRVM